MSLVLEILSKGDKKIKTAINNNPDKFLVVLQESKDIKGSKWDDLVVRFEWRLHDELSIREHIKSTPTT